MPASGRRSGNRPETSRLRSPAPPLGASPAQLGGWALGVAARAAARYSGRFAGTEKGRTVITVGLTGGIASGKSTVARRLAEHGETRFPTGANARS